MPGMIPSECPNSQMEERRHRAENEYTWKWGHATNKGYALWTLKVVLNERPEGAQGQEVKDA